MLTIIDSSRPPRIGGDWNGKSCLGMMDIPEEIQAGEIQIAP